MTKRAKSPRAKARKSRGRVVKTVRAKSVRAKSVRAKFVGSKSVRAKAPTKPARTTPTPVAREPLDQFIDAAAHALALPVEPAWKGAVKANLEVTLRLAASFADFPLPDDAEPAPVFVA
ncbi:MAG: hypothetical protein QOE78_2475 [Alphaproteobacteria bacterium]|jgi:hypothetical protein|nr:hypothetical protein [Alphaproteobacteria bacterium]